jgi:hypothetical protein
VNPENHEKLRETPSKKPNFLAGGFQPFTMLARLISAKICTIPVTKRDFLAQFLWEGSFKECIKY